MFPVTAVNCLKIQQYSLRNLLCYRKNCLCETASTCSAEFLQRISVRKGAGGLTPVKADKPEGFVKIQSTGNAGSSPRCLTAFCSITLPPKTLSKIQCTKLMFHVEQSLGALFYVPRGTFLKKSKKFAKRYLIYLNFVIYCIGRELKSL